MDVAAESYVAELGRAFEAAGELSERITVLEDFAADFDDDSFSTTVHRLRHDTTGLGERLALLLRLERDRS